MEHEFILSDADISGTHLLEQIRCSPKSLLRKFPELEKDEDYMDAIDSMNDRLEKYSSGSITIVPKSNPSEIYTVYASFGTLRIGGFEKGENFEKLKDFLED